MGVLRTPISEGTLRSLTCWPQARVKRRGRGRVKEHGGESNPTYRNQRGDRQGLLARSSAFPRIAGQGDAPTTASSFGGWVDLQVRSS